MSHLVKLKNDISYWLHKEEKQESLYMIVFVPLLYYMLLTFYFPVEILDASLVSTLIGLFSTFALMVLFAGLLGNVARGIRCTAIIYGIWGLANAIVINIKDTIIMPEDIKNISAAFSVASRYSFKMTYGLVLGIVIFIILWYLAKRYCNVDVKFNKRVLLSVLGLLFSVLWALVCIFEKPHMWIEIVNINQYEVSNAVNVGPITYFLESIPIGDGKPSDYNENEVKQLLASSSTDNGFSKDTYGELPNIIVIMNESFADLNYVNGIDTDKPVMPFMKSLSVSDNTITGCMDVSIFGGLTACTEYEFLTGCSMLFFDGHLVPYNDIYHPIPSMVRDLKNIGYDTLAMHCYDGVGYNRRNAYKYLGFDNMEFIDDMDFKDEENYHHGALVDQRFFEYIAKKVDNSDKPIFSFNVTMQNHSPYIKKNTFDLFSLFNKKEEKEYTLRNPIHLKSYGDERDFMKDVTFGGTSNTDSESVKTDNNYEVNNEEIDNYLSLVRESDEAFKWLINHYEHSDKPTIIMMFGDHQPNLEDDTVYQGAIYDDKYGVPFAIWSNFDTRFDYNKEITRYENNDKLFVLNCPHGIEMSSNYGGMFLMDILGFPLNNIFGYLKELRNKFPVVSRYFVRDEKLNNSSVPVSASDGLKSLSVWNESLNDYIEEPYIKMQYYIMNDAKINPDN